MAVTLAHASKLDAEAHAHEVIPEEACGLLVQAANEQKYLRCRNICETPEQHFILDPRDYLRASLCGTILAIIHSHPQGQQPSEADRKACQQSRLPWFIYQLPQDQWVTIGN